MAGAEEGSAPADVRIVTNDKYRDVKMTVQVFNPSYSLKWSADKKFKDDPRYSGAGKLVPKFHTDFVFVEHMVYHMDEDDGRVAVLLPHGVLFRDSAEETIRKYIGKDLNRIDAVIGLLANLFHGTSILNLRIDYSEYIGFKQDGTKTGRTGSAFCACPVFERNDGKGIYYTDGQHTVQAGSCERLFIRYLSTSIK